MEIGVIGINEFAKAFCKHWIAKGHKILFADLHLYSGGYTLAEELGPNVSLALPAKVARMAEVIVLAVPQKSLITTAEAMGDVQQKIIIDLISEELERIPGEESKSSFEEIQTLFPNAKVVKITSRYPTYLIEETRSNTLYTYSNDNLAQRLVHWFTEGLGYRLVDLQNNFLKQAR